MQRRTIQISESPGESNLPVSSAVIAGNTVYTAGHVGWYPGTDTVPNGIEAQTEQALRNLRTVLEASGTTLEQVVKVNIYLADVRDFAAMNAVYRQYFPSDPPARTTIGAQLARADLLIEIEMVAVLPTPEGEM